MTHPIPEAPSDGLIQKVRGRMNSLFASGDSDTSSLLAEVSEALTQAAAKLRETYEIQGAALDAHEALSSLCEWFGQRGAGNATTNSEARMFERCYQASSMLDSAFKLAPGPSPLAVAAARIQVLEGELDSLKRHLDLIDPDWRARGLGNPCDYPACGCDPDAICHVAIPPSALEAENGRTREALKRLSEAVATVSAAGFDSPLNSISVLAWKELDGAQKFARSAIAGETGT